MYILKNAWISISRNKGRNILIGIIVLIVATMTTVALAINNTASNLIGSYESAYDKEVTISFNREEKMKDFDFSDRDKISDMKDKFSNMASYSVSDIENFATSEHIKGYRYTYSTSLNGNNIEKATTSNSDDKDSGKFGGFGGGPDMKMPGDQASSLDFTITGYNSIESMSEFIDGTYQIDEIEDDAWEKAFDGNYVFINSELASYNDLTLGSKIKLKDEDENVFTFTVIGIFSENSSENSGVVNLFSNSANTIITNSSAVTNIIAKNSSLAATLNPTFIIDDYNNVPEVQAEFYKKGLDETFKLETNEELANSGLDSIKNVKTFATTFLIIAFVIGGIVLFIVNMINIRERKYEIGVFRTIGVSKSKLTMQFISELLIVSLISLTLGATVGAISSKGISNALLASEISSSSSKTKSVMENFGGGKMGGGGPGEMPGMPNMDNLKIDGAPTISAYDSIDAIVGLGEIFELLGLGLILILISSLASMISIQKFSPLTILKERS